MGVLLSCGGDQNEPTPAPKTDQKATYTPGTLPTGVSLSGTELTVPETITDADLKKAFENGTVTDPDGKAGITTVAITKNSLTVTYYGTDGTNPAQTKSYTTTFTIKRVAVTAQFPATIITGNSFTAGTENIFAPLFSLQIPLSDGTTVQPTKILVNDQEVTATHTIHKPTTYVFTVVVADSKGNELSKKYNLTVEKKATKINNLHRYGEVKQPLEIINKGVHTKNTMQRMGLGNMIAFLKSGIFKSNPNIKPVIILEQNEENPNGSQHEFLSKT